MSKKLVVFDVDGTILDSFGLFERVIEEYSREQGLPYPCVKTIKHGYADPHAHDFLWGVDKQEQERHLYAIFDITDARSMSMRPEDTPELFVGVKEAMEHLKDTGHTLAIITSKPEAPLLHLLDHHKVGHYFATHRNMNDIARRNQKEKPEPDMLHCVMHELGFVPDETVMIGDTTMDIRMGRAAQTHTIGVTWGTHTRDHLHGAGAHVILETDFHDVVPTIKKIFE